MRGRKPQPTALKVVRGEKRPSRVNPNEPVVENDEVSPTMSLTDVEREVWNQLVPDLVRANIAKNTDAHALTMLVQAEAVRRDAHDLLNQTGLIAKGSTGQLVTNPVFKAMLDAQDRVSRLMVEFGMTASSRTRIDAPAPKEPDGFGID